MQTEIENYTKDLNGAKELVLSRLLIDKIITEEQAEKYSAKWNIIMIKPKWFEGWFNKFWENKDYDGYSMKYVKFED